MEEKELQTEINRISITGTLVENKLVERVAKEGVNAGKRFISGEIIVKAVIDGVDNFIPINLYSWELTQDGKTSKNFTNYKNLSTMLNARITVTCSDRGISEKRFWSAKTGTVVSQQIINGKFIAAANAGAEDSATFEFSGYVGRELIEKIAKDESVYAYEIILGQANYKRDSASLLKFNVRLDKQLIIDGIKKSYIPGVTVHIYGDIRFVTSTVQREQPKVAFGEPQVSSYVVTHKSFFITSGDEPITEGTEGAYTMEEILKFKKAIAASDVALQKAVVKTAATTASTQKGATAAKAAVNLI